MIQNISQGMHSNITINELYNIIDIYDNSFSEKCKGHDKCICKSSFNEKTTIKMNNNIEKMSKYLLNHYENINNI